MKIKEILEYGKNNLIRKVASPDVTNAAHLDEPRKLNLFTSEKSDDFSFVIKEDGYRISKMILKHLLNATDSYILINNEDEINEDIEKEFKRNIELLNTGIPIQYITNKQEFMRLDFYVDSNVLIPQPDTEILVEEVITLCKENTKILDLCTGSGAIGVSIAKNIENAQVTMSDISEKALEIANKNAKSNEVLDKCNFVLSDMFESIQEKYDFIVSNPPYIKSEVIKTLDKEVQNEPHIALDGGKDGLYFYRIIAENAYKYLNEDGILALEIGYDQKEEVISLLQKTGKYSNVYCKKDLSGNNRIIICRNN